MGGIGDRGIGRGSGGVDKGAGAEFLEHGGSVGVPGSGDAATEDEHIEIEDVDHAGEHDAEIAAEGAEDAAGVLVALEREMVNCFGAELGIGGGGLGEGWSFSAGDGFAGHAEDGAGGGVAFGASAVAAAARMAFGFEGDVAELAGHAIHAVPDFSLKHDAAADSGAKGDDGHVGDAAGGAQPLLAEGGDVGVVFEDDAGAEAAFDLGAHWIFFKPREVGGLAQHSSGEVDDAGDADAGAEEFSRRLVGRG